MASGWLTAVTFAAALGSGIVAGVFFTFSVFVMRALSQIPAEQGIAAMRSVNVTIVKSLFLPLFFGTAACCLVLLVAAMAAPGAIALMIGSVLYLFGVIAVTVLFNVPLNNSLAAAKVDGASAEEAWTRYSVPWTEWNHVPTLASLAATAAFIIAL